MSSCQPQSLEKGKVKALDPDRMLRKRKLDYDYSTCNTSENRDGGCNSSQLQSSHPSGESNSVSDRKAQDPDNSKCSIGFDGLVSNVSDPDVMIKLLLSNLRKEEERLRKLNMVKKYREKMPPKKRQRILHAQTAKNPGVAKCHLQTHFSTLPDSTSMLKNGHVLFIYMSCNNSRADAEKLLQSKFPTDLFPTVLNSRIKCLALKASKFKKLNDAKELELFREVCDESFNITCTPLRVHLPPDEQPVGTDSQDNLISASDVNLSPTHLPQPDLDAPCPPFTSPRDDTFQRQEVHTFSPGPSNLTTRLPKEPSPSKSALLTRSISKQLTPRKERLKRRLDFTVKSKLKEAKAYQMKIKSLTQELKFIPKKRILNQAIKRKNEQLKRKDERIAELEEQLKGTALMNELTQVKRELKELKHKHLKLKRSRHKKRKVQPATVSPDFSKKISQLETEKDDLKFQLEEANAEVSDDNIECKKDGKTYNSAYRRCLYNCNLNQVPVEATGQLISHIVEEMTGKKIQAHANPTTVSQCAYELGILTDIQLAETLEKVDNANIAWDATSLDAEHVNEIHINFSEVSGDNPPSLVLQVDVLAGGTTADYTQHICQALNDTIKSYSEYKKIDEVEFHRIVVQKIKSTLSDRVSVNHCVRVQLEEELNISLLELKCNVHPLDGLASQAKKSLKIIDSMSDFKGKILGKDTAAVNMIYGFSKMRYKNGTGDPKGFKHFMKTHSISPTMMIRYVGNRMHVLFHLAGTIYFLRDKLVSYLETSCNCNTGFRTALLKDLSTPHIVIQLKALGLIGKLLTGPWMTVLYSNKDHMSNLEAVPILKDCFEAVKKLAANPTSVLQSTKDCFGRPLDTNEQVLSSLKNAVDDEQLDHFNVTMKLILQGCVQVLERQLADYLTGALSSPTKEMLEATQSAPVHNIASERVLGLTDSQWRRAPNATIGFIDGKVKGKKNKVLAWMKGKTAEEQDRLISYAVTRARKFRTARKKREAQRDEMYRKRLKEKAHRKDRLLRGRVGKKIRDALLRVPVDFEAQLLALVPHVEQTVCQTVMQYLKNPRDLVGQYLNHIWDVEGEGDVVYCGKIIDYKQPKTKPARLTVAYWLPQQEEDEAADTNMKFEDMLTDYLLGDMSMDF